MHDILAIYKQLELRFDENGGFIPFGEDETVSYDEKTSIQAIETTSRDKVPIQNGEKLHNRKGVWV